MLRHLPGAKWPSSVLCPEFSRLTENRRTREPVNEDTSQIADLYARDRREQMLSLAQNRCGGRAGSVSTAQPPGGAPWPWKGRSQIKNNAAKQSR
jgi:hypothetical protein